MSAAMGANGSRARAERNADAIHTEAIAHLFDAATQQLARSGLAVGADVAGMPAVAQVRRRRSSGSPGAPQAGYLSLVKRSDGLLDWAVDLGPAPVPSGSLRRRAGVASAWAGAGLFDGEVINQALFKPVEGSQVAALLERLDAGLNPRYGLYDLDGQRVSAVAPSGRILLIVHGTFSKGDAILSQWRSLPEGERRGLFDAMRSSYTQCLVFEHPTLAVSPLLNAVDLARAFAGSTAQVDVIGHSRGGLVARWWLEVLEPARLAHSRAVFFGAPLLGTSLASPHRLRSALQLLTNYAVALREASAMAALALPLFTLAQGLMTLVASATALAARTPAADAVVAMVPGLAGMSRYGADGGEFIRGNAELQKLAFGWGGPQSPPLGYFAVSSNFEPDAVGWQFWRAFRQLPQRGASALAGVLFEGANDLVVDSASMGRLGSDPGSAIAPDHCLDFGRSSEVHHLNYFSQARSTAFLRSSLGI